MTDKTTRVSLKQLKYNVLDAMYLIAFVEDNNIPSWNNLIEIDGNLLKLESTNNYYMLSKDQKRLIKLIQIIDTHNKIIGIATVNHYNPIDDIFSIQALKYGEGSSTIGAQSTLEENIISNAAAGATSPGTLFNEGMTFTEFAKKLLIKDLVATANFTVFGSGLHEKGEIVNNIKLKLLITNLGTVPIKEIHFYKDNELLINFTFINEQLEYSLDYENDVSIDTSFKAKIVYTNNNFGDSNYTKTINFVSPSYYGIIVGKYDIVESNILGLNKIIKNNKGFDYNNISMNDSKICYAYPANFGKLSSIKDANNFEYIESYEKISILVNNEDYFVYLLIDPVTVNNFKQKFS